MKATTSPITVTMLLLNFVISTGSFRLNFLQNFVFSADDVFTLWGSLMVEDIESHSIYNDTRMFTPKQSWSKANLSETDWMFYNMFLTTYFYYVQIHSYSVAQKLGIKAPAIVQCQAGAVGFVDDPETYFYKVAIDGEDTVHLNLTKHVWVAGHSPYSRALKAILDKDKVTMRSLYNILTNVGQKLSRILSVAGKEAMAKKIKPEVYFIMKPSKPELVCLATGFYPGSINITLWKDKENIMDNVTVSETLPNGDGTYQERAIVTTGWEDQTTVYCKVEHISLEEPLVREINMRHNVVTGIATGAILGVVICVSGLIWLVKKRRRTYTSIAGRTMDRIIRRTTEGNVSMQR